MSRLNTPLSDEEIGTLDDLLFDRLPEESVEPANDGIAGISELDGFLTAIVSGPTAIPLSRWLPLVWGSFAPDEAQAETTVSLIIRHMNSIVNTLMQMPEAYEPIVLTRSGEEGEQTVVDSWCEGYMKGVSLAADAWRAAGEKPMEMLFPVMLFASEKGRKRLDGLEAEEIATMQRSIPRVVRDIHAFWLEQRQPKPFVHDAPLPGRNDPCPCGSGKKYKKCCLH